MVAVQDMQRAPQARTPAGPGMRLMARILSTQSAHNWTASRQTKVHNQACVIGQVHIQACVIGRVHSQAYASDQAQVRSCCLAVGCKKVYHLPMRHRNVHSHKRCSGERDCSLELVYCTVAVADCSLALESYDRTAGSGHILPPSHSQVTETAQERHHGTDLAAGHIVRRTGLGSFEGCAGEVRLP
jgi:hypothetical protein